MTGRLHKFAYQMHLHCLGGWALDCWGIMLTLGGSALVLVLWLLRGRPAASVWHWLALALVISMGIALLALRGRAARGSFVVFTPQPELAAPAGQALHPTDKISVQATGTFQVEGRSHFFADLLAYWRTFASREHTVMAIVHESRFLGMGRTPAENVGMWYIFFRPEAVEAITPGWLTFGLRMSPALCVIYRAMPATSDRRKRRAPAKPIREIAYLAFADEPARTRVWADLLADVGRL